MARYPGFVGPSYTSASKIAADDQTMNWVPAKIESGTGPAAYVFDPAPGYTVRYTLSDTPTRGFLTLNGGTFAVGGNTLYELPVTGAPIVRATGLSNLNRSLVSMAGNGDGGFQLAIASDSTVYSFNVLTNTLTTITDPRATDVVFQDAYFIAMNPSTSTIALSALEDGLTWDALDVAQRNDSPDKWIKMIARPKEIWLFGSQSTSVYYDSGDPFGFPYIPNPSVAISYGTAAPASVALLYGSPIWLAHDLTVRYANGYAPTRVSTHAIEHAIGQYATVSDADAFAYTDDGHAFYVLNFPTAQHTWVYDLVSGLWHERGAWTGLDFGVSPVWGYTFAFGKHLVGDRVSGNIYEMSSAIATDTDGVTGLRRVRRAPHLTEELRRTIYDRFQLLMEVGLGLASGQGSDPQAMLRWSDDGGQTWSAPLATSVGPLGDFRRQVVWRKLGQARDRVFEVSVTDPIPWRIMDAFVDARVGAS